MQCIRTKRRHSPASSTSLSAESLNKVDKYFKRGLHRKSFLRRSFDLVRKNVIRRSVNLLWNDSKSERNWFDNGDHNNNKNGANTEFDASKQLQITYGEGDALSFSTDCDMPDARDKQRRSNER